MSKLTKEEIKRLESTVCMFNGFQLMCDGYKITIKEYRSENSIRAALYVNGAVKGAWLAPDAEFDESKFYKFMQIRVKKNILEPKCRKTETKTLKSRDMDFSSVGQALRHLNKVCDSVEIYEDKADV
ncbi:MAG: hypothetical protein Q4P13_12880 [Psychrobacter sp.]|nr:hypothetical protein [Psychrobacter sp.]